MKLPVNDDCLVHLSQDELSVFPSEHGQFLSGYSVFTEGEYLEKVLFFSQCIVLSYEDSTVVLPKDCIEKIVERDLNEIPIVVCRGVVCRMYEILKLQTSHGVVELKFPLFNKSCKHLWFFDQWLRRMGYAPASEVQSEAGRE